jgi:hypothetical protein
MSRFDPPDSPPDDWPMAGPQWAISDPHPVADGWERIGYEDEDGEVWLPAWLPGSATLEDALASAARIETEGRPRRVRGLDVPTGHALAWAQDEYTGRTHYTDWITPEDVA